jgi:hypothetical protein
VEQNEFKLIIMKLYEGRRTRQGEGADITVLQLLAKADSEYKCLKMLGQWTTKNKASELLGLQAKFDVFQAQFQALVAENKQIKQKLQASQNKPEGQPKPEENDTRTVDGQTWYFCKHCYIGRRWNRTHKTSEHKCGVGKQKDNKDVKDSANLSEYDANISSEMIPYSIQVACIAATSRVVVISDDVDDVHDKFPSDLTVGEGQSIMLNILLEAQAVT